MVNFQITQRLKNTFELFIVFKKGYNIKFQYVFNFFTQLTNFLAKYKCIRTWSTINPTIIYIQSACADTPDNPVTSHLSILSISCEAEKKNQVKTAN